MSTNWKQNEFGTYYSYHIFVIHYGEQEPKYHVLENPDGDGWVIGVFYPFYSEYVPLEENGEERLVFPTAKAAFEYVDFELEGS